MTIIGAVAVVATLATMWGNIRFAIGRVEVQTKSIQRQLNGPLAKIIDDHGERLSEVRRDVDQLPCEAEHARVDRLEQRVERLEPTP